jgi:hypothetical protein
MPSASATRMIVVSRKSLRPVSRWPRNVRCMLQKSAKLSWDPKPRRIRISRIRLPRRRRMSSTLLSLWDWLSFQLQTFR